MNYFRFKNVGKGMLLVLFVASVFFNHSVVLAEEAVRSKKQAISLPDYFIGPEDVIDIYVWKNAELSKQVIVRPDGRISLPLIGEVNAAGLTPDDLRKVIVDKLKDYQETVIVSVIIQEVNSYRIFILGEVAKPGMHVLRNRTTLLQAIAIAGGFNQFASQNKIVVIREKNNGEGEEKLRIRFDSIVDKKEKTYSNPILRAGDTIFVP